MAWEIEDGVSVPVFVPPVAPEDVAVGKVINFTTPTKGILSAVIEEVQPMDEEDVLVCFVTLNGERRAVMYSQLTAIQEE